MTKMVQTELDPLLAGFVRSVLSRLSAPIPDVQYRFQ